MIEENQNFIPYPYETYAQFWKDVFHDTNFDGIIFICGKTKNEKFFTIRRLARHELNDYLKNFEILPNMDYYYTINHFMKKKGGVSRRSNNFFSSCGVVVDIDIHKQGAPQEYIDKTLSMYKANLDALIALEEAFPYHYCIETGRGYQFVYIYEKAINYKLQIMNKRMQELILKQHFQICDRNPDLGIKVDAGTTKKLSGVYRIPGTYNTKAHKQVTLSKTDYPFLDTSKIIDTYGFFDEPIHPIKNYHVNPAFKGTKRKSRNISHCKKMINAIYQYQEDGYANSKNPGHYNRNCTCFVLIHFLLEIMSYEDALENIISFNNRYAVPLPEKRIKSMLDYAYENYTNENKIRMRFLKTSTVIDYLGIEDGEYGIHDTSEERKKLESERAVRREKKNKRDEIICKLLEQRLEYKEIARQASCSLRTVNRVVNKYYPRKQLRENRESKVCELYLTGMPYTEIAAKTNYCLGQVNDIIKKRYPKQTRPKPWKDVGMKKKDFYEQYKNTFCDKNI